MLTGVALVGVGNWGQKLLRAFGATTGARVVAVCDVSRPALDAAQVRVPSAFATTELDAVLAHPAVDAVVVATPPASHAELASRALGAGKHVFVEKPMTLCLADACELELAARASGRRLMVGHILEFHPAVRALGELVHRGELGRLRWLASRRLGPSTRRQDGAWWSFAPHDVSVLRQLVGGEPVRVRAAGSADVASARFDCEAGVTALVHVSAAAPSKVRQLAVFGSERIAVFDDVASPPELRVFDLAPDDRRALDELADRVGTYVPPTAAVPDPLDGFAPEPWIRGRTGRIVPFVEREPLLAEVEHFVHAVGSDGPMRSDAESGRMVVSALEAGQSSIVRGGKTVVLGGSKPATQDATLRPQ